LRKYENKIRSKTRDIEELRNELENNNNNSRRNENDVITKMINYFRINIIRNKSMI
jgi:hypothetical protein